MQSFLCRLLVLVFTFNCIAPAPGVWAQSAPRRTGIPPARPSSEELQNRVNEQVEQQMEESLTAAVEAFEKAEGTQDLTNAIVRLHGVMDAKYAREQQIKRQQEEQQRREEERKNRYVAPASSTYVAPRIDPNLIAPKKLTQNEVLARLAKDELLITDMIDYIDPFDPAQSSLLNTVYASEVLGNSIDAFLQQPDDATIAELNDIIPMAQLRVLYRLNKLLPQSVSSTEHIMAVGSLRITLWKLHTYFTKTGQEDPLLQAAQLIADEANAKRQYQEDLKRYQRESQKVKQYNRQVRQKAASTVVRDGPRTIYFEQPLPAKPKKPQFPKHSSLLTSLPPDVYGKINAQFLQELNTLKAANPEEGDREYQLLLALADYATVYAMLTSPNRVKEIVKLFDGKINRNLRGNVIPGGDFKTQYSAVLNAIFTAVFEMTKYSPRTSGDWYSTVAMLKDFSDPEQYSIPTRIFALEAASLLFGFNPDCQQIPSGFSYLNCNTVRTDRDDQLRALFAARTVDIYAPLNCTHYLAMEDYGLDSKQMQMLADKLAYIYNGFANDDLQWDTSRPRDKRSYVLDKAKYGRSLILNGPTSVPRLAPLSGGHLFQLPNGKLKIISGFGRSSRGYWVEMNLQNGINAKKRDDEYGMQFALFVGNAIFWVYGGEVFSLIGTAYRTTKGAMMVLPKAIKAASTAQKGHRTLAFTVNIQKGVRYANTMNKLNKAGVTVLAETTGTRMVTRPVAAQPAAAGTKLLPGAAGKPGKVAMETVEETFTQTRPIRSMSGLRNPNLTNVTFSQPLPGFTTQLGTVNPAAREMLKGGIRNYDQWRRLSRSLIGADGKSFQLANLTGAEISALRTEAQLMMATRQAAQDGAFDLWLPLAPKGSPINAAGEWYNMRFGVPQNMTLAPSAEGLVGAISERIPLRAHSIGKGSYLNLPTNPMDFSTTLGLPSMQSMQEWIPSLTKHLMETKQFSVLGEYALKNTRFWSGFNQNLKFFGAWAGLDMATYPFMQSWIIDTAAADQNAEMKKHGDAFDPAKLAEDQAAQEEQEREIIAAGGTVNNAQLSTYNDVVSTQNTSSEGALVVFPILAGRHSLGNLSFVSDQDKAAFDIFARRIQLNRAMREQAKVRKIKYEEMKKQAAEQLRTMFKEQIAADKTMYEEYFLAVGGPAAKARITALFNAYEAKVMAVLDASDSPDDQYEKITQAQQEIEQALQKEIDEANRMQELLMEQQQQTISEEEYNPWEGFNAEEAY
ncbi:hypothetical protein [Candidatus Avelusimicrobium alvi]|uniref:hypothetical protein n=1 Tax=Candidatus Avelusimicrobium alvi TaxID=3416221 RepID=UPI003D0A40AD